MKLARHLLGYAPVKLVAALCAFGGIYVFTRLLDADQYGRYALMFSVMALMHTLSLTWVEAAAYRFTAKAHRENKLADHFRTSLILLFRALGVGLFLVIILLIVTWDMPNYRAFVPYIALLLPFNTMIRIAQEAHKASQQVKHYALVAMSKMLLGFIVGALLAWQTGLGAVAPFAGLLFASLCLVLIEGRWLLKQAVGGRSDKATRRAWLSYGVPTAIALMLDILLSSGDRFFIAYFIDEAAVGGYAAGYGVADKTVLVLCAWVAMASSPLMMAAYEKGGRAAAQEQSKNFVTLLLLVGLPAATGLALVADPLAEAMIGENVREQARQIIPWIAFAGLFNGLLIHYFTESFNLAHKTRTRALLMCVPLVMNIVLNIILIPIYGVMGAVISTLACYITAVILLGLVGRKYVSLGIPVKDTALIIIACAAMWPVIYMLPAYGTWAELFIKAAAGGSVYMLAIYALNVANIRQLLKQTIAKL
ncbi:MAG: oligosaccharide flippase family protein [Robiginitomaculum sp.]|nr:oligosaccharide flippase family protein [Robiginitomaculum sp.]